MVCSPTRVHVVDFVESTVPVSPTCSSLTTQNSRKAAQFKTLHFDSEIMFVRPGVGVITVACHDGQVRVCMRRVVLERGDVYKIL